MRRTSPTVVSCFWQRSEESKEVATFSFASIVPQRSGGLNAAVCRGRETSGDRGRDGRREVPRRKGGRTKIVRTVD